MFLVWLQRTARPCLLPAETREPLAICRRSLARGRFPKAARVPGRSWGSPGGGQDRGDDPRDVGGLRGAVGVGEQQVRGADQGGGLIADLRIYRTPSTTSEPTGMSVGATRLGWGRLGDGKSLGHV